MPVITGLEETVAHYMIVSSHNNTECASALNTILDWGMQVLSHMWFGCKFEVHTGWLDMETDSEQDARNVLPPQLRREARVVQVSIITPEEVRALRNSLNSP